MVSIPYLTCVDFTYIVLHPCAKRHSRLDKKWSRYSGKGASFFSISLQLSSDLTGSRWVEDNKANDRSKPGLSSSSSGGGVSWTRQMQRKGWVCRRCPRKHLFEPLEICKEVFIVQQYHSNCYLTKHDKASSSKTARSSKSRSTSHDNNKKQPER